MLQFILAEGYVPGRRDEDRVEAQMRALGQGTGKSPSPPGGKPVLDLSQAEMDALERSEIQQALEASERESSAQR